MLPEFPLIVADESVDARVIRMLSEYGFSVYSIAAEKPGISDSQVVAIAIENNGYIVTEDKDFGDILVYNTKKGHKSGSMLLRIFDLPVESKNHLVLATLLKHHEVLIGRFSVLTSKKLRIRPYNL